ncbi:MAG: DsbA family protein [Actinobacteria bacterium]|nr:MAG: DsbA family protein [Actinomycetota bacterium]
MEPVTPRVLVFFDYACQFCYLDWPRLKRLRAEHAVELVLVPFELRPELAAGGASIDQIGGRHSEHVEEHMTRMAREGGIPLVFPERVPNTHLALTLGEYAREHDPARHERVHEAIFSAYNGHGEDIGDADVLARIAVEQGFDEGDVRRAFDEDAYGDRLHHFFHVALSMGITGTPAALVCNELFIGTRPYQVLVESLQRCLVTEDDLAEEGSPATIDR